LGSKKAEIEITIENQINAEETQKCLKSIDSEVESFAKKTAAALRRNKARCMAGEVFRLSRRQTPA
jgi:hypothetical protein